MACPVSVLAATLPPVMTPSACQPPARVSRRQAIGRLALLPAAAAATAAWSAVDPGAADAVAQPSDPLVYGSDPAAWAGARKVNLSDPEIAAQRRQMPTGRIGNLTMGRLICGSNLISMNMHARDLRYVNDLARAYNTADRILWTLKKCEEQGGNSIVLKDHNFQQFPLVKYWTEWGSRMLWHADVITTDIDQYERRVVRHLELGADTVYLWGGASDIWFHQGQPGKIIKAYEIMRQYDVPVGICAHRLEPIVFCEREGLKPDYYMKTLHHDRYWSAHPPENRHFMEMYEPDSPNHGEYHDNLFCHDHERTIEFMQDVKVPWIAFKVLAAGAIPAAEGIRYAFESGADFVCLGMFDFQVEQDAHIVRDAVTQARARKRPWIS
jgi:hypothetical protein